MDLDELPADELMESNGENEDCEQVEQTATAIMDISLPTIENCEKRDGSHAESIDSHPLGVQLDMDVDLNQSMLNDSISKSFVENSTIKPIDKNVVHRICSGQVVVTLATAVKELVENSIDAGATSVDIRLVEFGSKSIEVTDNGCGVQEANFEGLGLKHHTSKIQVFEDLTCVETFGFRGEALSSLCALSSLTVITKSKGSTLNTEGNSSDGNVSENSGKGLGFRIEYNTKGRISQKSRCAREVGTTVILKNLFSTLPVRHTEFLKNIKREFSKMVNILYGYCLITNGVRITCVNQLESGAKSKVVSVPASNQVKEKIVSLFGSKQLESLVEIKEASKCEDEAVMNEYGLTEAEKMAENPFKFMGYISLPHKGRSSADRQFYFINSRPCDPTKISRIVNEVYHLYSRSHQTPFIFLDIRTKHQNVDVNVTPDKRQLYLRNEKILYASIKETLTKILAAASTAFNPGSSQLPTFSNSYIKKSSTTANSDSVRQDFSSQDSTCDDSGDVSEVLLLSPGKKSLSPKLLERKAVCIQEATKSATLGLPKTTRNSGDIKDYFKKFAFKEKSSGSSSDSSVDITKAISNRFSGNSSKTSIGKFFHRGKNVIQVQSEESRKRHCMTDYSEDECSTYTNDDIEDHSRLDFATVQNPDAISTVDNDYFSAEALEGEDGHVNFKKYKYYATPNLNCSTVNSDVTKEEDDDCVIVYDDEFAEDAHVRHVVNTSNLESEESFTFAVYGNAKVVNCIVDWCDIKTKCRESLKRNKVEFPLKVFRKFRAGITTDENNTAEEELKKQLNKDMFQEMQIIGQFNHGFIIVKHGPDLFIVDQHATDEKYNFENLQQNLVLQSQRLISPMDLQLPAVSENILIDNLDVFKKNGFDFCINEDETSTRRVQMTQIPYSKSCEFGKEDVEELIFMLEDAPEKAFYRPTKVKYLLASRACRKSVMIGTALNMNEMRRIVDHMGDMEQPWNCPHGRPTIRHLLSLDMIPHTDIFKFNH